jgi:hypothetical protein
MKNVFFNAALEFDARAALAMTGQYSSIYQSIYPPLGGPAPTQQVVDAIIYSAKVAGQVSSYSDLFKSDDSISVGKCNIDRAMLPANTMFLVTGIAIQYAEAAGTTDANLKAATFGMIPVAMRYGEITISTDGRPIVDKLSMEVFHNYGGSVATGDTNAAAGTAVTYTMEQNTVGFFQLANPKWIYPQVPISVDLRFAAALGSANSCVKILLFGAKNVSL